VTAILLVRRALLALLLCGLAAASAAAFQRSSLIIETLAGQRHHFEVELALSTQEMMQGLLFRESLAERAGMLFVVSSDRVFTMWMKNTLVPLDMLFIASDGTIRTIATDAEPLSLAVISSQVPVRAVLEVPGGTAARLGLTPGDRVLHPLLVP